MFEMGFAQIGPSFSASLTTAGVTALCGIIVFVLGQFVVKLIIDPLQENRLNIYRGHSSRLGLL